MGLRIVGFRVLRRGSKKELSRRRLVEGRSTSLQE